MGHGASKQEGEAANQETQEANPTEPAAAALAEPERPSKQRQIEDLLEGITRRLPLAAAPACPPRPVAANTAAASNGDSPMVGRSASPPPRWLSYPDIDAAACHLFGRVEKSGGHAVPLPAGHLSACCRMPDSLVPHHSFTMYGQPKMVPQVLNYPQPGGEEHEFLRSEKVRFAELHELLEQLIDGVFLTEGAGSGDEHAPRCSFRLCYDPSMKSMACFGRDGIVHFNAAQGVDGGDGRPWFLAACHLLAHCWSQGRLQAWPDIAVLSALLAAKLFLFRGRRTDAGAPRLNGRQASRRRAPQTGGGRVPEGGACNRRPAAAAPQRPDQQQEEEAQQEEEQDTDASSSGCDEGTTDVDSITGDGAGAATDDGGGSAAASSSTGSGAGFAATDNSAGQAAMGLVPAGRIDVCKADSQASSDDDDEGWETGGQGGAPLSNAAMEAAAVRLFGRGGGSTQSLVPAAMPAAAHSLHLRLHLLIAEVFLADSHVSPHFQLVWDPEDDALGYVSAAGVACFNAAADLGEPAHSSDAPARREHQASRSRPWFLAACRLLSQCLTGSHQDLSLAAEVHAQVVLRYKPRFSQVASLA